MGNAAFEVWQKPTKGSHMGKICEALTEPLESVNLTSHIELVSANDGLIHMGLVHRTDETIIALRRMTL